VQKAVDKLDFETALAQLEAIVGQLEQGQIGLTESLERYELGIKHLKRCYQLLESAEKKVAVLSGMDAQGHPQIVPFSDAEGNSLAERRIVAAKDVRRLSRIRRLPKIRRRRRTQRVRIT
jgi:exodeoxyribonuclease VII small subunit